MKKAQSGILIFLLMVTFSCSQERLIPISIINESLINENFNVFDAQKTLLDLGPKAEKITIKNASQLPIITKNGTKIYLFQHHLTTLEGKSVSYPYDVEIVELRTLKDMILYDKPTVSYGEILSTAGSIYINATKDKKQLIVSEYNFPSILLDSDFGLDNQMMLFYGELNKENQFNWFVAPNDSSQKESWEGLFSDKENYQIFPAKLGWINVDKFADVKTEKTSIVFKSLVPDLERIMLFLVLPEINSVMHIYGGKSFEIPVGMEAHIVAVAKDSGGQFYSYFEKNKISKGLVVEIKLTKTTENEFLEALKKFE